MSHSLSRRAVLMAATGLPFAIGGQLVHRLDSGSAGPQPGGPPPPARISRALVATMLPETLRWNARLALAREVGFDGLEMAAVNAPSEGEEIMHAAEEAKLSIHAVSSSASRQFPLSSGDPEVVRKGVAAMKQAITVASTWKAEELLIVPAVVDGATSYGDAWARSQAVIRDQLLPLAAGFKVRLGLTVPGDKFLLSPLECNRYIDEFRSPWVKATLNVGDATLVGYAQDWIRTLGKRLARLRLRDCHVDRQQGRFEWRNLGDGDVDWQDVRHALADAPYAAWVTADLQPGDRAYLADARSRVDKFLAGFKPAPGPTG